MAPTGDRTTDEEVIPILHTENASEAVEWYERLGFSQESVHRFEPGLPAFVTIVRGSDADPR